MSVQRRTLVVKKLIFFFTPLKARSASIVTTIGDSRYTAEAKEVTTSTKGLVSNGHIRVR